MMAHHQWVSVVHGDASAMALPLTEDTASLVVHTGDDITPSAKAFLLQHIPGVYTCTRVCWSPSQQEWHVVLWDHHVARLCAGIDGTSAVSTFKMTKATDAMVARLLETTNALRCDLLVTILWVSSDVHVHGTIMPQLSNLTGARVLVSGRGRENPRLKHTQWIHDREALETRARMATTELGWSRLDDVVLSTRTTDGEDRELLEGLITNFYVVRDNCVETAEDDVLVGVGRALVIQACDDLDIPVIFKAPRFSERRSWQTAFLTSVVRTVMTVKHVVWDPENDTKSADWEVTTLNDAAGLELAQRIRSRMVELMRQA